MQVSVEALKGLERKLTVSVPAEQINDEVNLRLKKLVHSSKLPGFRPGKAPLKLIKSRFSAGIHGEVLRDKLQSSLSEALEAEALIPAVMPQVNFEQAEEGKDFIYSATFEVLPHLDIQEVAHQDIEMIQAFVTDTDVDNMIEKLRGQNKTWKEVSQAVKDGDKVLLDFKGYIDDEPFEGGEAKKYEVILGENKMIPGFETGLIGHKIDKPFDLKVTFPKDYNHANLAGKDAVFKVTIHQVYASELPELDETFVKNFNIQSGKLEDLKADIRANMERELAARAKTANQNALYDVLLKVNEFDVPQGLIEEEIKELNHQLYHQVFGHEHHDDEKIPDFPRNLFEKKAERRVRLGLLFDEYVKKHSLVVDNARVDAMIDLMSSAYEDKDMFKRWCYNNEERLSSIKSRVLEELFAEKIGENLNKIEKTMSYDEVMALKQANEMDVEEEQVALDEDKSDDKE